MSAKPIAMCVCVCLQRHCVDPPTISSFCSALNFYPVTSLDIASEWRVHLYSGVTWHMLCGRAGGDEDPEAVLWRQQGGRERRACAVYGGPGLAGERPIALPPLCPHHLHLQASMLPPDCDDWQECCSWPGYPCVNGQAPSAILHAGRPFLYWLILFLHSMLLPIFS